MMLTRTTDLIELSRKHRRRYRKANAVGKQFVLDDLANAGMSIRDIATFLGISVYEVRKMSRYFTSPTAYRDWNAA